MVKAEVGLLRSVAALRAEVGAWRTQQLSVALVPTMGALHDGHLSLVERAKVLADRCVVSIFVNPKQFGPNEDLDAYPRDEAGDVGKLRRAGADAAFLPGAAEMYPQGFSTTVSVAGVSEGLCGAARPGHFDGVATVVTKLLLQCLPDIAIFGEKDYQQLMVIRRLAIDLDIPVKIIGSPILREADGLAMSSRNAYLSADERRIAPLLHSALKEAAARLRTGAAFAEVQRSALETLRSHGFAPDYLELRDADSLAPLQRLGDAPARLLIAAKLGRTRLIDNVLIDNKGAMR